MEAEDSDSGELRRDALRCNKSLGEGYSDRTRGELDIGIGGEADKGDDGTCT